MDRVLGEAADFEELAAVVEERAERVLRHAERAREEAERAPARDNGAQELRLWEARMHEQSAELLKKTAALYTTRARDLRAKPSNVRRGARTSLAAEWAQFAAERERIAAEREALAVERERIWSSLHLAVGERSRLAIEGLDAHRTHDQPPPEQAG